MRDAMWMRAMLRVVRRAGVAREYKLAATALLDLQPGETALDVGCGLGDDACDLAARVGPRGLAMGVDLERPEPLDAACGARFVVADARTLPFGAASVDAVRIDRVLHLLDDAPAVLRECARVLRRGGRLVAAEPDVASLRFPWIDDAVTRALVAHRARTAREEIGARLPALLSACGLRVETPRRIDSVVERFPVCDVAFNLPSTLSALVSEGAIALADARAWVAAREAEDAAGRFRATFAGWVVRADWPRGW